MGRKKTTDDQQIVTEDNNDKDDEFKLNLNVLDGNALPADSDSDEQVETQPRKRRKKKSKKRILGADYQAMEEKRLENLLFGGTVGQFTDEPQLLVDPEISSVIDTNENETDPIPTGLPGNDALSSQKPAWVDEDDEVTK